MFTIDIVTAISPNFSKDMFGREAMFVAILVRDARHRFLYKFWIVFATMLAEAAVATERSGIPPIDIRSGYVAWSPNPTIAPIAPPATLASQEIGFLSCLSAWASMPCRIVAMAAALRDFPRAVLSSGTVMIGVRFQEPPNLTERKTHFDKTVGKFKTPVRE